MQNPQIDFSEKELFEKARCTVLGEFYDKGGIGTYKEKALHRILKLFFEPNEAFHEVKHLGFVADIKNREGIIEIQTRSLSNLREKLKKFLPESRVTVVYPLPYGKYIRWIDREMGEISERRKSPKRSNVFDAVYELYNIREFIREPNFSAKLIFLNVDEFRYKGGKVIGRQRKSVIAERIPLSVEKIIHLDSPEDYKIFVPEGLPEKFTAYSFGKAVNPRFKYGYSCISILREAGIVGEGEKVGKKTVYTLN